jgi:hypothetical protein
MLKASFVVFAILAYIASPFYTAWSIREAVRNGDSAYLERQIDWQGVRATLAPTISQIAFDMPSTETAPQEKPGLWKRFKAYVGQGAVNRAIDSYVTPEGLPQLFAARKAYRDYVSGESEEYKLTVTERIKRAWSRVKRAEFTSLTTFEIDMLDKNDPERMYQGKLKLESFGWKLKELRFKMLTTAAHDRAVRFAGNGDPGFIARARAAAR